jgi:predicted nucleic acid-binding protein
MPRTVPTLPHPVGDGLIPSQTSLTGGLGLCDDAPLTAALDQVEAWLESPTLVLLAEPAAHWTVLRDITAGGHIAGGQVHDARVAALCVQHGVRELWSADRDWADSRA